MGFLFGAPDHSNKGALVASVNYGRALILMSKQLFVRYNLLTPLVCVAAPEHQLAEEVSGHSIHPIKLTFVSAEWAGVGVLLKPVSFTIPAQWLFTNDALNRIFQNIITDTADELS